MNAKSPALALNSQDLMTHLDARMTSLRYMCLSSAGLAISSAGSAKKKVKISNTTTYLVNGVFCSKTTAEVAFTATTHDIAANASSVQEACYLLTLVADGTPTITMGTVSTGAGTALLPSVPSGGTPIGFVRIAVAAGSTIFDATSDDLDAAHLTTTYVNLGGPVDSTFAAAL
jgi:hypothetical protein